MQQQKGFLRLKNRNKTEGVDDIQPAETIINSRMLMRGSARQPPVNLLEKDKNKEELSSTYSS